MASISAEREKRQIKVFTKWVNSHLRRKNVEVEDLKTAFEDGVNLCYLYEIIADDKLPRYSLKPRGMIQKTNNLSIALKKINSFVDEIGIRLQYSPQQVASGDERQVLGMLWILITKFVIPESEESLSRKRSLLRWVQRVTEPYDNVDVKNFHRSWKDGMAFNALLDQFDDTLMDYAALNPENSEENCENAFAVAEKIGIYRLLDVEDITDFDVPDEKSVMTYVSTMYQFFKKGVGVKLERESKQLEVDIAKLLEWIEKAVEKHQIPEAWPDTVDECNELERLLGVFNGEKAKYANYKCRLYLKLAGIQRIQRNERLKVFSPPEERSMSKVHRDWENLNQTVVKYSAALRAHTDMLEEQIRQTEEEWIKKKEEDNKMKRESEMKQLTDEINNRENEEKERLAGERGGREEMLKLHAEHSALSRENEMKQLVGEIVLRETEEAERREEERRRREELIKQQEEDERKKRDDERKEKETEIEENLKDEEIQREKKRQLENENMDRMEEEERQKRDKVRKEKEDEITQKEEAERTARKEERDKINAEKKAKELAEYENLNDYDTMAIEVFDWINSVQSELTTVEEVAEDEEDESTDEETREKRKSAVVEVKEKIKPVLEKWEVLVEMKIEQWATFPCNEVQGAADTFCYALTGEENDSLGDIRKFKLDDE